MPETPQQAAKRLGYSLTWRQEQVFTWRCDLYRKPRQNVKSDNRAKDRVWGPLPDYIQVPCYKIESKELNAASMVGRTNDDVAFTIDQLKVAAGQEIEDGWLVFIYSAVGAASDRTGGQCYVTQGGAEDKPSTGIRTTNQRIVYLVKMPTPPTIQPQAPVGV